MSSVPHRISQKQPRFVYMGQASILRAMEHSKRGVSKREPTEEDSANNRTKKYLTIGVVQQKVGLSFGHSVTETVDLEEAYTRNASEQRSTQDVWGKVQKLQR